MSRRQYAIHRWLGAAVGLQLFLWSLGGFIFATHDIEKVRGEAGRSEAPPPALSLPVAIAPADAAAAAGESDVEMVRLHSLLGRPVYALRHAGGTTLVDASTGEVLSPIDEEMAVAIARADRRGDPEVRSVTLVEDDPPVEYRGGPLPAWRVALADGKRTNLWIAADSGRVVARRNDAWRRFDFFWMLHTMDYRGRDDFNHPLLVGFAALSLVTVTTGGLLWFVRLKRRISRRRRARQRQKGPASRLRPGPRSGP